MRSIRLSLVLCLLGLLGVALTVASLLLHDTARRTLAEKEQAAAERIEAHYQERVREERQQLDDRLLAQARTLASGVRPRYRWDRIHNYHFHSAGYASTVGSFALPGVSLPSTVLSLLQTFHQVMPPPKVPKNRTTPRYVQVTTIQWQIWHHYLIDLKLGPDVDLGEDDVTPQVFSRIETNGWDSAPLFPDKERTGLPYEGGFAPGERLTWVFDDAEVAGQPVRRIRFRARITLDSRSGSGGKDSPAWPRSFYVPPPAAIIIQCAADQGELNDTNRKLAAHRDQEIAALRSETASALERHWHGLLWISGFTFVGTALGSLALVWLGLAPLSRLSESVSRVSPKNFALDVEESRLPSELRPIVGRMNTTLELLRRAFARQKQMTADVSHELRTPLAALLTTLDLALRKERTAEQYREFLSDCRLSATQMHQIVERLLTLARLDAGVDRLKSQPVDVAELAGQCASVVRPLAEARGLSLELHAMVDVVEAVSDGPLLTDPDKLREVLTNLLHNAVQYNRPSGRIDVRVQREDGRVRVEVSDTGIGIAPEAREHIFERFYRADPSRNADDLHAGLGLAIVKEYVELMGGRITVESEEGQGSTFRVELPVHGPAQAG